MIRNISYEVIPDSRYNAIVKEISNPEVNMEVMKLETAPKVAVYSPKTKQPWDDAVTLVLSYAEIPYTVIYDEDVLNGDLQNMIGCICTMKILPDNMENFGLLIAIRHGIKIRWRKMK